MHTSTVTGKGQIVIPAPLRRKLGIRAGTRVAISETPGGLRVQPLDRAFFEAYAGLLPGEGQAVEALLRERAQQRDVEDRKVEDRKTEDRP